MGVLSCCNETARCVHITAQTLAELMTEVAVGVLNASMLRAVAARALAGSFVDTFPPIQYQFRTWLAS